jgi:UPF0271 protein
MVFVLDSSALFSMEDLPEDHVCPPGVIDELLKYKDPRVERWGDLLRISECTQSSVSKVKEAASKSGDMGRLSDVDISVIALAIDLDGIVLTDDYSIQNVCSLMNINYRSIGTDGIKKVEKWNYRCNGCGKWYKEKQNDCPICGSTMRKKKKK